MAQPIPEMDASAPNAASRFPPESQSTVRNAMTANATTYPFSISNQEPPSHTRETAEGM